MKEELEKLGFVSILDFLDVYMKTYGEIALFVHQGYGGFMVTVKRKKAANGVDLKSDATIEWIKELDKLFSL